MRSGWSNQCFGLLKDCRLSAKHETQDSLKEHASKEEVVGSVQYSTVQNNAEQRALSIVKDKREGIEGGFMEYSRSRTVNRSDPSESRQDRIKADIKMQKRGAEGVRVVCG